MSDMTPQASDEEQVDRSGMDPVEDARSRNAEDPQLPGEAEHGDAALEQDPEAGGPPEGA